MEQMGLPTHADIIAEYARLTGLDLDGVVWYQAFACWKTAVAAQQLYDRHLRDEPTDERMVARGARVAELAELAERLLHA